MCMYLVLHYLGGLSGISRGGGVGGSLTMMCKELFPFGSVPGEGGKRSHTNGACGLLLLALMLNLLSLLE